MAKTGKTGGLGFGAYLALVLNAVAWLLKVICDKLILIGQSMAIRFQLY